MTLTEFLVGGGYTPIPLTRGKAGHFHAEGSVNGSRVDVVLDTGAAGTVVSMAVAEALGLELSKLPYQGGGAGNAQMDLYTAKEAVIELSGVRLRPTAVIAMDMSHVNEALARKGQAPVEVVLGADVFTTHSAVIDYVSSTVFLRP